LNGAIEVQNTSLAGHHREVADLVTELTTSHGRGRPRSTAADLAIVHATIQILVQDGYDGLTMAGVAQRAGVSTATLYRRYESKVDLVVGCITTLKDQFHEPVDTGSLAGDIRALVLEGCAAFSSESAGLMKALIGEVQRNPELGEAMRERMLSQRNDHGLRLIELAVERGEIAPPADPELALQMIMGPFVFRSLVTGEPVDGEFADHLCTLALRLLGATDDPGSAAEAAR
jgi:AcrR family transcriptional regulator